MEKVLIRIMVDGTDHGPCYFAVCPKVGEVIKFKDKEVKVIAVVHEPLTKMESDSGEPGIVLRTEKLPEPVQSTEPAQQASAPLDRTGLAATSRRMSAVMKPPGFKAR